jgi:hypothetical protein
MSNLFGNSRLLSTTAQMHGSHDITSLHNEIDVYSKDEVNTIVANSNGPLLQNINLLPPPGTQSLLTVNPNQTIATTPVSAYGKSLLDTTSLADLRTQILENTNEEAIRLLADGNNELNFYTGGTGASNLRMQITNSVDLLNNTALNVNDLNVGQNKSLISDYVGSRAGENLRLRRENNVYIEFSPNTINMNENVLYAENKHLKQKIEDNDNRVLVESVAKRQYCLYSFEAGSNSGLLIQATPSNVIKFNNYRNSVSAYQPISINSTLASYLVCGADINPTSVTSANFISNGVSLFCDSVNPILDIRSTSIKPYVDIIPNGANAQDLGTAANYFGNLHVNSINLKNDLFIDFFNSTDIKNDGFYFRSTYGSGSGNQDNMSIRGHNNSGFNDGIAISAYGGVSINCGAITATNDNGTDAATNRVMLLGTTINNHRNMLPYADGALNIGSASLKFNDIYANNIRANSNLYTSSIRPYSGSVIDFNNANLTLGANKSISADRLQSTSNNSDLVLGNGATDKIILRNSSPIEIFDSIVIGSSPPSGLIDLGTAVNPFGSVYTTTLSVASTVSAGSVSAGDVEAYISIIARGNNSYMSVEDDTATNGKVQIISENSATYTGYISFIKNNIRQLFLGFNNALQFENGSNFVIKSDQQNYLNFIHDATPANRKIQISCDLLPDFDLFHDLGSATNRFSQIHGNTLFAGTQLATNQITSYDVNEIVNVDSVLRPATNNTRTLGDGTNRWSEIYANNGTINTSDRNDKKDIEPIKNALSFVRKLEPVQYRWKDGGKRYHTGYISQDVLTADYNGLKDQWAGYVDTGNGLGLRYTEFISVNTQSIKELDCEVQELKNENDLLKQRVLKLEKMLEKLILS